jgi:purine-binding chemotaxis protein CheW
MKNSDTDKAADGESLWTLLQIAEQHFALPSDAIMQVTVAPAMFPLPYAPAHIIGMAHYDGDVMPCVALDVAFGLGNNTGRYQECAVIRHGDRHAIIMATAVLRHIALTDRDIHSVNHDDIDAASANAIVGEISIDGRSVFLLDPPYLVSFSARKSDHHGRPGLVDSADSEDDHDVDEELSCYLYIGIGSQHYAVDVNLVSEIVTLDSVTPMPGAPAPLRGLCIVRDRSYLLLSSSQWLGISTDMPSTHAIVVITSCGEVLLDVDSIDAVARVSPSQIRPLSHADSCLNGVIEVENEMLRGILNVTALPRHIPELQRYIPRVEDQRKAADEGELLSYLLVRWDKELFAIDLADVVRLEQDGQARSIEDERFSAVFNFDGDTIPVLREDFFYGMPSRDSHRDGYLILSADGSPYAVSLQNAERIITTSQSNLLKRGTQRDERFAGTIRHNDRLVTLVNMSFFRQQASHSPGSTA